MTKDRRTKAELLDALNAALRRQQQADSATRTLEHEVRKAKAGTESAEEKVATLKRSLETIRQVIWAAVAMKHPKTVAFGGIESVWYQGRLVHPGYEGDSEEVRLLSLIDGKCQEALK